RRVESQRRPGAPVLLVGAPEVTEVVRVESRRVTDEAGLEPGDAAAVLPELELCRVPPERGAAGILMDLVTRLLEVVHCVTLSARDRIAAAGDARGGHQRRNFVVPLEHPVANAQTRQICARMKKRLGRRLVGTVDGS